MIKTDRKKLSKREQFVHDHPNMTWEQMANELGTTPAAMIRAYDRLEKKNKANQDRIQTAIYRGEIEVTDADGVTTMADLQ